MNIQVDDFLVVPNDSPPISIELAHQYRATVAAVYHYVNRMAAKSEAAVAPAEQPGDGLSNDCRLGYRHAVAQPCLHASEVKWAVASRSLPDITGLVHESVNYAVLKRCITSYIKHHTTSQKRLSREQHINIVEPSLLALGGALSAIGQDTVEHLFRTQFYVRLVAEEMSKLETYRNVLTPENVVLMANAAPLHDIGKVAISSQLLGKCGKFTVSEFDQMKRHVVYGRQAIEAAVTAATKNHRFTTFAVQMSYYHHEKWDGSGYPEGLAGQEIPLAARIMALADVYDALRSTRPYKPSYTHAEACAIVLNGRGTHFDPDAADAFVRVAGKIEQVSSSFTY